MSYKDLKSYQQATIIYDFTVEFCACYVKPANQSDLSYKSYRTADQMEQAARSGKQNLAEGSAEHSQKSELYLLGIARASFQELLEDYEDFLRQRGLQKWGKDEPAALAVRQLYKTNRTDMSDRTNKSYETYETYGAYLNDSAVAANAAICLIHQVNFLLDRQIKSAEEKFVKEGGYNEKLSGQRNEVRKREIINRFWRKYQ